MKISIHSYANKTNFHMKSFALSLAYFIVRFTATQKWPILSLPHKHKQNVVTVHKLCLHFDINSLSCSFILYCPDEFFNWHVKYFCDYSQDNEHNTINL